MKARYITENMGDMMALLDTLRGIQRKYGQKYCYPSQEKLLKLLREFHGIDICRRTLNYWLGRLEKAGFIHRIKRHFREAGGPVVMRSTAYYISDRVGRAVTKARRFIGMAKRMRKIYPSRVQSTALNRCTTKHSSMEKHKGDGPSSQPSHIMSDFRLPWGAQFNPK